MPHLFGTPGGRLRRAARSLEASRQVCVSREFTKLPPASPRPVAGWLRSLARELHAELGGPGVGALGMCFTGGFALAMMVDTSVAAPVLAQPSAPFAVGRRAGPTSTSAPRTSRRSRSGPPPAARCSGCATAKDPAVGRRFDTLRELGESFITVEFDGRRHATLTAHRQQEGVDRVLAFFEEKLVPMGDSLRPLTVPGFAPAARPFRCGRDEGQRELRTKCPREGRRQLRILADVSSGHSRGSAFFPI